MALFQFLLVLTSLAFISTVNGQQPPKQNCRSRTWKSVCCQGESYAYPGYFSQTFEESCSVEPKTENLSFQDSAWLAYDCHVRAWLNGSELTKQSFITWISHLPQSSQSKLWSILSPDDKISAENAEDEMTKIYKIKSFLLEYFKAVVKICTSEFENGDTDTQTKNSEETKVWEKLTRSLKNCSSGPLPSFLYENPIRGFEEYKNCRTEFYNVLGNETYHTYLYKVFDFCFSTSKKLSLSELQKEDLSFHTAIYNFIPTYWSKSVKKLTMENILQKLSPRDSKTRNEKEIIGKLWHKIDEKLADFQNENSTSGTNVRQILRNLHFGAELSQLTFLDRLKMCKPDSLKDLF